MSENMSDFLSVFILLSVPVVLIILFFIRLFKKIKFRKKEQVGKYYPEW